MPEFVQELVTNMEPICTPARYFWIICSTLVSKSPHFLSHLWSFRIQCNITRIFYVLMSQLWINLLYKSRFLLLSSFSLSGLPHCFHWYFGVVFLCPVGYIHLWERAWFRTKEYIKIFTIDYRRWWCDSYHHSPILDKIIPKGIHLFFLSLS